MSSKTKTTAAKENGKPALVPKLRFPEFRDAEGWDADELGVVADFVNEKIPVERIELANYVSTENLLADYGGVTRASKLPTTGSVTRYRPDDTLVSNIRPYLKKVWVADKEGGASNDVIVIRAKQRLLKQYFSCLLKNDAFIDYVMTGAKGVKMPRGDIGSMKAYPTRYPSKPEQQKIAECLSSVDELMAAQARKVDALKTHKKGLMQQLFPREGETQPRLRFPEFQNAGEWEEVALGEIAEIKLGKMLDKQKHTTGHLLPYLNNLAVRWNEVNTSDLPKMYFSDRELDRFGLRAGDVVVCEGGEPGRAAVWDGRLPDLKFQKAIHRVRFNVPFEPKILVLHLENLAGTTQFEMLFTGGGIKHLTGETFSRLKIPLIPHAEQQRIASCLSSLDALITAETRKLEALKTHKKGLMQQIFPSPEEVEG